MKLKSCAHCGGEAEVKSHIDSGGRQTYTVSCQECHMTTIRVGGKDKLICAKELWNTRCYPSEVQAVLDAAKAVCDYDEMDDELWSLMLQMDEAVCKLRDSQ